MAFLLTLPFVMKSEKEPPFADMGGFSHLEPYPLGWYGMCCAGLVAGSWAWLAPLPIPRPVLQETPALLCPFSPLEKSFKAQTRFFLLQFRTAASCSGHQEHEKRNNPFLSAALVHIYSLLPRLCAPLSIL